MDIELKQIITQILAFLIMLWILKRYAWGPLLALLHKRTQKIQAAFSEIEEKHREADLKLAEYSAKLDQVKEESHVILQNAVKEAQKVAQGIQADAQIKATEILKKSREQAALELEKARIALKKELVDVVFVSIEKLVNIKLTNEDRDRISVELLDEV